MNLFYTITAYPPSVGGAQNHMHELCKQLANRHSVRVASFWGANRTDWLRGTTWRTPGGAPYNLEGIPVTPIAYTRKERAGLLPWALSYYFWQPVAIRRIARTLLPKLRTIAGQVDLVHHGRVGRAPLGFASLLLARENGVPFVLSPFHHPHWNGKLYWQYHKLYRQADAVIALTPAEKQVLTGIGVRPERIFVTGTGAVLSNTYDATNFRDKYQLSGPIVLFIGQKYAYKGIEPLLEAAPLVWQQHPEARFVFIGPRTSYSRALFSHDHDARIVELNTISLEEKTSALAACDVLCLPSSQECFGSVFVEAWKMGKPVIGSDIAAIRDVITDGVDGFTGPAEASFLAEKINALISDPELRLRLGEAGRERGRQFEWVTLAESLEKVYRQLAQR